jgi:uncharacterized protein YbbC (DUF1343 family)
MRPFRYAPQSRQYRGQNLNGILFTLSNPEAYYPVTAGMLLYTALLQHHGSKMVFGSKTEWFDKLYGNRKTRAELMDSMSPGEIVRSWNLKKYKPIRLY